MRWRFAQPSERQDTERAIATFWTMFEKHRVELDQAFSTGSSFDVVAFMHEYLAAVHPDLMWEFGPAVDAPGHRLVVTPEQRTELTELSRAVVTSAPILANWQFYHGRLPEDFATAASNVSQRTGGDISAMTFTLEPGPANLIDLTLHSRSQTRDHDALLTSELMIGEAMLNAWAGVIQAEKPGLFGSRSGRPINDLPAAFAQLQRERTADLPARPYAETLSNESETLLIQTTADEADDYPRQRDRFTWLVPDAAFVEAVYTERFASERFSRNQEHFAFVKIDGTLGLDGSTFEDRADIEDALDTALRSTGSGCLYGGGHGLRYVYIDLALTDLNRAVETVVEVLATAGVPERSWLQFHDLTWLHEWIGVYPTTPPPPLA